VLNLWISLIKKFFLVRALKDLMDVIVGVSDVCLSHMGILGHLLGSQRAGEEFWSAIAARRVMNVRDVGCLITQSKSELLRGVFDVF
jgi:hypothetical protein